jgi:hypothetical protein
VSLAITFGSPSTNAVIARLAGRTREELEWRLRANGCWVAEYREGGTTWVALMTADPGRWGAAVARFAALLHDEPVRLPSS